MAAALLSSLRTYLVFLRRRMNAAEIPEPSNSMLDGSGTAAVVLIVP
jgi:hypothetical protein